MILNFNLHFLFDSLHCFKKRIKCNPANHKKHVDENLVKIKELCYVWPLVLNALKKKEVLQIKIRFSFIVCYFILSYIEIFQACS